MSVNPLTSLTEWVVHILMICGTNPNMVNEAATIPNIVHHIFLSFYSSFISQRDALRVLASLALDSLAGPQLMDDTESQFLSLTHGPLPRTLTNADLQVLP